MSRALDRVREGAVVYDRAGERIGTVREIFLGTEPGAATSARPAARPHSLLDDLLQTLAPPAVPEVVRERLLREGFVRIDTRGPFATDRYAFGGQVQSVSEAGVTLDATLDDLVRR
jgi:hypothetical protein